MLPFLLYVLYGILVAVLVVGPFFPEEPGGIQIRFSRYSEKQQEPRPIN